MDAPVDLGVLAADGSRGLSDDRAVEGLIGFLRSKGAAGERHAGDRTLLDHLVGTYQVVRRWNQAPQLQRAALIHSVYGTDSYHQQLLPFSRRDEVIRAAGAGAERLAYLFCVTPRDLLFAGTHVWAPGLPGGAPGEREMSDEPSPTRAELDGLVLLHMANLAEQAQAPDGSPGRWLVRLRELAELLIDSDAVTLPLFLAELARFSDTDESLTARAYRAGTRPDDELAARVNWLALAAATCSVVPEPCLWLAHLSRCQEDPLAACSWARCAQRRLLGLGTAWDKRLPFEQWLHLARLLERPTEGDLPASVSAIADPRALLEVLGRGRPVPLSARGLLRYGEQPVRPLESAAGRKRFHSYIEMFAQGNRAALRGVYPDLESEPWYDPEDFPLASYLEAHFEAIREEILGLEPSRFHRESERIKRAGEWEVAFFYERGRRREDVCDACPVTTRGIEGSSVIRTEAGLIYASRMQPGAHIGAHRGPTNLRLRCHLGIKVPDGDCAIRVGDQTRSWREGQCLVFNDHFDHEAWNHTDEDRIVLILDIWHPGLSATEVRLLEGLHTYAYAHARQLNRYWASNAAAAGGAAGG